MKSLMIFLGKGFSLVFFWIPFKVRWAMVTLGAFILFDMLRFRRQIILLNLETVFPKLQYGEKLRIARASMARLLYNVYEFCLFPIIDQSWIDQNIEFRGLENLQRAYSEKKGVLLLSLHLGHGDLAISVLAQKGFPLYVISKHFKSKWLNDFWFGIRRRFGANYIDPHGHQSAFEILKAIKKNGGVIFVLDQYMGPPYGVESTFFGVKTGTAYGLSLFAVKTGAPVVPVWAYRTAEGKMIIEAGSPLGVVQGQSKEETLLLTTESYNRKLESLILKHPEDWMWIHRRWKKYIFDFPVTDKSRNMANRN